MGVYYETGIEEPEVMGSGSHHWNMVTTQDEDEAKHLFKIGGRNYLWKVTTIRGKRVMEEWEPKTEKWVPRGILGSYQPSYARVAIDISRDEMKKLGFDEFPNDSTELVSAIHTAINKR